MPHVSEAARYGSAPSGQTPPEPEETVTVISITPHQPPTRAAGPSWPAGRPPPGPQRHDASSGPGRHQRSQVPSPEERPVREGVASLERTRAAAAAARRSSQLLTTAEVNNRFSPEIRGDEGEDLQTTTEEEYRVEDIKQEIERLERRQRTESGLHEGGRQQQQPHGGRISTNGSLTHGKRFWLRHFCLIYCTVQ